MNGGAKGKGEGDESGGAGAGPCPARIAAIAPLSCVALYDHFAIHVLELSKWRLPAGALADEDRWLYYFKEAQRWESPPEGLDTAEFRKAMAVLRRFTESDREWDRCQAREQSLMLERTIERERQELREEVDQARAELERARAELERARAEQEQLQGSNEEFRADAERLRELLRKAGIDPPA
jgi:hypothetical protein